ncbi:hypothetical protein L1887_28832 [Cichorium endivia]|nr:hypothetical protein L1887_28832 [Cichorium endivia]
MWDSNVYKVKEVIKSRHYLVTVGEWTGIQGETIFANIYGPQGIAQKRELWNDLANLKNCKKGSWIVFGDFNVVRREDERYNSHFCRYSARDFNQFIFNSGLCDLKMGGFRFTYFCQRDCKLSKLDRFLVSHNLINLFPQLAAIALPRDLSDHCPIVLQTEVVDFGKTPFRFFNSWMFRKDFDLIVKNTWAKFRGFGTPDRYLMAKLKFLKNEIRKWRALEHLKETGALQGAKNRMEEIDKIAETRDLSLSELADRKDCFQKLVEFEKIASCDLKQRARLKWSIDGDENTKFFHAFVNNKKQKNCIRGLNINGSWTTNADLIKKEIMLFYKRKFAEKWKQRPKLTSPHFRTLSAEDCSFLEMPFSLEEIKQAVWDCGSEKAPGPDGFTFKFVKKYWDVLSNDVLRLMKYFEVMGHLEIGCNSSFITLVPKVKDPLNLSDYRPISLIGCTYKIIAKTLANRLKRVIGNSIDEVQTAFIEGRNILEGPLVMNEICAWAKKQKKNILLFKADFEKAFDSVNWCFLNDIMAQMGYGDKWRMWIMGCLRSARASILVNGSPTKEFSMEKGVRQGDPLSPFLFIMVMEGLNVVMKEARIKGLFTGIKIPHESLTISHLFYADDALFVGEWCKSNIKNLARILRCFFISSGLRVNFHKSKVFGVGVDPQVVAQWAAPLGCSPAYLPFSYLGVPVGANMRLKKNWTPVIDRFQAKLSTWKAKSLSFGGRLTLIKAVLGSLPTYYFSLFVAPLGVLNDLEKLRRKFLWGGVDAKKSIHWVSWDRVTAEKKSGGLGVGSLKAFNRALIVKWWWRFRVEKPTIWSKTIKGIHNLANKPANYLAKKTIPGVWNQIAGISEELDVNGLSIDEMLVKKVGSGRNTLFWLDKWIGDSALKSKFPMLYNLESRKRSTVADRVSGVGFVWDRDTNLLSSDQLSELHQLRRLLGSCCLVDEPDQWICPWSPDGKFHVDIIRSRLDNIASSRSSIDGPFIEWIPEVPTKVLSCIWKANLDRLPTKVELEKRGISLDSTLCVHCINGVDASDHILVNCSYAKVVWQSIFHWCKIHSSHFTKVGDLISFASHWGNSPKKRKRLICIVYGTLWWLWKSRCDGLFNSRCIPPASLAENSKSLVYTWLKFRGSKSSVNWFRVWKKDKIANESPKRTTITM